MFHGDICTVSIITWGLDKYGHFNDVILNWHQVYSIGGATHIHNLNNCPRANAFLCKKKSCLHKYKNRADCMNGNVHVCVLWPGSTQKIDN